MGTRGKIVDVIPQVPKSSHWPPPPCPGQKKLQSHTTLEDVQMKKKEPGSQIHHLGEHPESGQNW